MTDYCVICFTEAVDSTDWFYNDKKCEHICHLCIEDARKLFDSKHTPEQVTLRPDAKVILTNNKKGD